MKSLCLLFLLFLGRAQHAQIMLGMLLEVLGGHPVTAQLRIPRELIVLVDDLLRRTADLAFRT